MTTPPAAEVCARLDAARERLTARPAPAPLPQLTIEEVFEELAAAANEPWPPGPEHGKLPPAGDGGKQPSEARKEP